MGIKGSEIGSLGMLVYYPLAVKPTTLYVWLAVRGSMISIPLDRLKITWLIQLLGAYDVRNYENVDGIQALMLKYLFRLLTYSVVQSPSWEANGFAASQEIPRIARNPKVHYRTHKRPAPVSI